MQSYSAESERELFPLSWLTQYGYCPRRCGLMALEQLWTESADTAAGRAQHERVHTARIERRSGQMNLYELPVFSRSLGVNGKCDCVEALETPDGVELPYGQGRYRLYPVEYKHGVVRDPQVHLEVLEHFLGHAANAGFTVKDITFSPIKGPEGNIEYLGYLQAGEGPAYEGDLKALVEQSHQNWKEEEP